MVEMKDLHNIKELEVDIVADYNLRQVKELKGNFCYSDVLQKYAWVWVKHLEEQIDENMLDAEYCMENYAIIGWIKKFFYLNDMNKPIEG